MLYAASFIHRSVWQETRLRLCPRHFFIINPKSFDKARKTKFLKKRLDLALIPLFLPARRLKRKCDRGIVSDRRKLPGKISVFFSYANFPETLHPFLQALPLTALNDALRAAMLDGAGLALLAAPLAVLAAWGGLSFLVALRMFRWS